MFSSSIVSIAWETAVLDAVADALTAVKHGYMVGKHQSLSLLKKVEQDFHREMSALFQ